MTDSDPSKQTSPNLFKWIKWKQEKSETPPNKQDVSPKQARQHRRCQNAVDNALKKNPFVRFLMRKMDELGCTVTEEYFSCRQCPRSIFGFFDTQLGVVICENYSLSSRRLQETIIHELIHAFDHCRAVFSKTNCHHVACSEIRATNLSGECHWNRELQRGHFVIGKQREKCVKRRAEIAVSMLPQCKEDARYYVDKVYPRCVNDLAPFDFIP